MTQIKKESVEEGCRSAALVQEEMKGENSLLNLGARGLKVTSMRNFRCLFERHQIGVY